MFECRKCNRRISAAPSRILAIAVALLVAGGVASAQGTGELEGQIVNGTNASRIPAGVEVDVISLSGGMSTLKTVVSDGAGRFRIVGLPLEPRLMLRATYQSVSYHQTVSFDSSGKAGAQLEVYETTASPEGVGMQDVRLAFQLHEDHLRGLESYSLHNRTIPPMTVMLPDGNLRISKAAGITELPRMSVVGPGSTLPLVESPLESSDGSSYYSLYPLRPGVTTFEVEQTLPYEHRAYTYRKTFYHDTPSFSIGVIPQDLAVSGEGLSRVQTDAERNFAVYAGGPVVAGTEVVWELSGGTAVAAASAAGAGGEPRITQMPNKVGMNALVIGPLLLMGFVAALWYSINLRPAASSGGQDPRTRALRERREQLIQYLAVLDNRFENRTLNLREHSRLSEQARSQLRRVSVLLRK
ncbi:MAG: hypothetical protein FJW35_01175 [Acidobacteria bacterium]|nr:hypothetical protein [Acidobacteriota bacterium]